MSRSRAIKPMLSQKVYVQHLMRNAGIGAAILSVALLGGVLGYHCFEDLSWLDSLLNASMILAGMGPVDKVQTSGGKVFASAYAVFSGVVFLSSIAIVMTPVVRRMLHRLHLDIEEEGG